jgi:hypothetical protein
MKKSAAVIASKKFLDEVWTGEPPTIPRLIELLDRLLVSYHDTAEVKAPYYELDPPERDWKAVYDQAGKRFRDFGLYPITDPSDEGAGTLMMGDAIDDIADITSDLRQTVWYAENHSNEYAEAYFREFYFHWGQHARELLLLLHRKQAD